MEVNGVQNKLVNDDDWIFILGELSLSQRQDKFSPKKDDLKG